jgi:hypothetical protein
MAKRGNLDDLMRDAYSWVNNGARNAAKEIMNDLAEAGPEWGGEFKDSWVAHAPSGGSAGGAYPYTLRNIPQLPATKREAERKTKFIIENLAPHAEIAMDLIDVPKEQFRYPGYGPTGDVVARGSRPDNGKRGDVTGNGNSRSTAPLFWYQTFVKGGKMQKALERGVRLAKPE